MKNPKTIRALFAFPGFTASAKLQGIFGDRHARVIQLKRRKKQLSVHTVVTAAGGVRRRQLNLAVPGDLGVRAIPWCKQIRAVFVCGFAQHNGLVLKVA